LPLITDINILLANLL